MVSLALSAFDPLVCYPHPGGGKSSMISNPPILCFDSSDHDVVLAVGMISLVVVPVPFVAMVCFFTWRYTGYMARLSVHSRHMLAASRFCFCSSGFHLKPTILVSSS